MGVVPVKLQKRKRNKRKENNKIKTSKIVYTASEPEWYSLTNKQTNKLKN